MTYTSINSVIRNGGRRLCPPEDTWQCLETFLILVTGEMLLASPLLWEEASNAALTPRSVEGSPTVNSRPAQRVSSAERVGNPALVFFPPLPPAPSFPLFLRLF